MDANEAVVTEKSEGSSELFDAMMKAAAHLNNSAHPIGPQEIIVPEGWQPPEITDEQKAKLEKEIDAFSEKYAAFIEKHKGRVAEWFIRHPNKNVPIEEIDGELVWLNRSMRRKYKY